MRAIYLTIGLLFLTGCPTDWGKESEKVRQSEDWKACHYVEEGKEKARPEGYVCRPAACAADGKSYVPRGICAESGTRCAGSAEPVLCASDDPTTPNVDESETCVLLGQGQAVCIKQAKQ